MSVFFTVRLKREPGATISHFNSQSICLFHYGISKFRQNPSRPDTKKNIAAIIPFLKGLTTATLQLTNRILFSELSGGGVDVFVHDDRGNKINGGQYPHHDILGGHMADFRAV